MQEPSLLPSLVAAALAPPGAGELRRARAAHGRLVRHRRGRRHRCGGRHDRAGGPATDSGPRLFERASGGAWSAATPLPGDPEGMAGPVVDAAGNGALGIAWRVDTPRQLHRHRRRHARARRDARRADRDRRRRRRRRAPPGAGDRSAGDALLAYNTATTAGPPQPARRDRHHLPQGRRVRYAGDRRLDAPRARRPSPWASDGTGVVAWTHDRRVYVVSVSAGRRDREGQAVRLPDGVAGLVAAARRGRGGHAGVGRPSRRRRHGPQPAQPLLRRAL